MVEVFSYPFMVRALVSGALIAIPCSILGVFVVYRRMAFIGAGVSHAGFAGVALAMICGTAILPTTMLFCAIVGLLIGMVSKFGKIQEDTSIGIAYSATMALGVFLFSLLKGGSVDLLAYLFGDILSVSQTDIYWALGVAVLVILTVLVLYKEFVVLSFDEELGFVMGVPTNILSYILIVLMSVSIVVALRAVGVIMVSALLVAPAATAMQMVRNFDHMILLSPILGLFSVSIGLIFAFYLDTPPGATMVLIATVLFIVSAVARKKGFFPLF